MTQSKTNKNEKTFGIPESLEHGLVTKSELPTLHHKSQPVVDALMGLLLHFFHFSIESEFSVINTLIDIVNQQ